MSRLSTVVALLALLPSPGFAAATAPRPLWGKSVSISWSEDRNQRVLPDGEFIDRHIERRAEIYVATSGRVFKRESAVDDGNNPLRRGRGAIRSGSSDKVIGEGDGGRIGVGFSGSTMSVTSMAERGARQMAVSFDPGFGSCQVVVVNGREKGAATYTMRSLTSGRDIEVKSVTTNPAKCSVSDGNVFER